MSDDAVLERFPKRRRRIMELRLSDPTFAETCADYADVADALESLQAGANHAARTRAELERQRGALEEEIVEFLTTHP